MTSPTPASRPGRAGWLTLVGILLVPVAIGGLLLAGLWKPADRLDRMTAAIVNLDTPVKVNGQTVPLGRQLAAGLVTATGTTSSGTATPSPAASAPAASATPSASASPSATATPSAAASGSAMPVPTPTPTATAVPNVSGSSSTGNFTWVLTDAADAAAGLASGAYATVVTIPSDFSAAATSYTGSASAAHKATIQVQTSGTSKLVDAAVSQLVTGTAIQVLNQQLTSTYVENVLIGFTTLHDNLSTASSGATQLAAGATQLGTGASSLASGIGQLGTGASSLASGIRQVGSGATALSSGLGQLQGGAQTAADGLGQLSSGAQQIAGGAKAAAGFAGQAASTSQSMARTIGAAFTPPTGTCAVLPTQPACATLLQLAQSMGIDLTGSGAAPASTSLLYQTGAAQQATAGVSNGLTVGQNGQPSFVDGLSQSAAGVQQIAGGLGQSQSGASKLAAGMNPLASGADKIASGAASAASGADQLATGATGVGSGVGQLAAGLDQAVGSIPSYSAADAKSLSGVVAQPVTAGGTTTDLFGATSIPYFTVLALWLGGLAMYLLRRATPARTIGSSGSVVGMTLRTAWPGLALGAAQGLVLGAVLAIVLGLGVPEGLGFTGLAVLAGIAFAAVNQALVAVFGGIGRFVSMLVAVLGLATAVVSTVPPIFGAVASVLPTTTGLGGLQAIVDGSSGAAAAAVGLVIWTLAGLAVTTLAIARRRVVGAGALRRSHAALVE